MSLDIAERIRQEWTPDRVTLVNRSARTSYIAGWLMEHGVRFESAARAERAAAGIAWATWMATTGRIGEELER